LWRSTEPQADAKRPPKQEKVIEMRFYAKSGQTGVSGKPVSS
jgi:hypothetical protein